MHVMSFWVPFDSPAMEWRHSRRGEQRLESAHDVCTLNKFTKVLSTSNTHALRVGHRP